MRFATLRNRMRASNRAKAASDRDRWAKFRDFSTGVGAIFVPILVGVMGYMISSSTKQAETNLKYVEIAVRILSQSPTKSPDEPELRDWAIEIVDTLSVVPLSDAAKNELREAPLPSEFYSNYSCAEGKGQLTLDRKLSVSVIEANGGCDFFIQGATKNDLLVTCRQHPIRLYSPPHFSASVTETRDRCSFEIGTL